MLKELWDECAFLLAYLVAVHDEHDAISIVAKLLKTVIPQKRTSEASLKQVARKLENLSGHLQERTELSKLIGMIAHSLKLHYFRRKRVANIDYHLSSLPQAA